MFEKHTAMIALAIGGGVGAEWVIGTSTGLLVGVLAGAIVGFVLDRIRHKPKE